MSKNIVICLDGTWNKQEEPEAEVNEETNVRSLYDICLNNANEQFVYYDQGVGTHWYNRIRGGISGRGLAKNIREAYLKVASHYEEEDKVFLFGFSRGAYTTRSLAGMIYSCGLLPQHKTTKNNVQKIFEIYQKRGKKDRRQCKATNITCPIEMIGVWDTVGALGIPITFFKKFTERFIQFHNTKLNPEVKSAYHAVAIDEQRESFKATLWDVTKKHEGQTVNQVWFAGVHSDIGGGYSEKHHSDIAFQWMLENAENHGLKLKPNHGYTFSPDISKDIHDSYKIYFGPKERRVATVSKTYTPKIHVSVKEKLEKCSDYKPLALVDLKDHKTLAPYEIYE